MQTKNSEMQPSEPSILYSKQFGLRHLQESLKGARGVSVIPYHVYKTPEEFKERHFPQGTRRFLLRTDFQIKKGTDYSRGNYIWIKAPRLDADEEPRLADKVPQALKKLDEQTREYLTAAWWNELAAKPTFIVHPTIPRIEIAGFGKIKATEDKKEWLLHLEHEDRERTRREKNQLAVVWRDNSRCVIHNWPMPQNDGQKRNVIAECVKWSVEPELAPSIIGAAMKLHDKTKKLGEEGRKVTEWQASYAVLPDGKIEFYDFLVTKLE